jgi:hypothetical protein
MRHCMACSAAPQIATAVAAFALLTSIPAPNRNHSCRVAVGDIGAPVSRHACWHQRHRRPQEGQSDTVCRTDHAVTTSSFSLQHSHGRIVSP